MTSSVVAPGKAVLVGEYAVLDGAPAIVTAVRAGVGVAVSPAPTRRIETPDGDTRFVDAALAHAPVAHYRFFAWNQPKLPQKAGFGGSAAATVAAHAAILGPHFDVHTVYAQALETHRRVQGGGSGIDVAASSFGGWLRYQRANRPIALAKPHGVFAFVWTGQCAKTAPRTALYLAWPDRGAFVRESETLVNAFADDPRACILENAQLLHQMAQQTGIDYRTPALDEVAKIAFELGGAAKASGAGGGDIAVAWLPDAQVRDAFLARCGHAGLWPLAGVSLTHQGVHLHTQPRSRRPPVESS